MLRRNFHSKMLAHSPACASSSPSLNAAGFVPSKEKLTLFGGSGTDLAAACQWLLGAKEPVLLRLAGGCLNTQVRHHSTFNLISRALTDLALHGYEFSGVCLHGGSQALLHGSEQVSRPCFTDLGPVLERAFRTARFLGVFPGRDLEASGNGLLRICRDRAGSANWDIVVNPQQRCAMRTDFSTKYFWDAEWQQCLRLETQLDALKPLAGMVHLFYEGRIGVRHEIEAVAERTREDPRRHIVLIAGGDPHSAPDVFARDPAWLREYPQVHVVHNVVRQLPELMIELDVVTPLKGGRLGTGAGEPAPTTHIKRTAA